MKSATNNAEVNIHLRARPQDKSLIDRAAALIGANRSHFMMTSALNEAKSVLLDQTSILADAKTFRKILDRLDAPVTAQEKDGFQRLKATQSPWSE